MVTLYDLVFSEDRRPSPYCWRAKLALKHKGLTWRDEPVGLTEKHKIAFAQSQTVPVIHDGTTVVKDSWAIAEHLERTYPGKPLFPNDPGRSYSRFINGWADTAVNVAIFPLIIGDLVKRVRPEDKAYIVESRGKRIGTTDFAGFQKKARETGFATFRAALEPARRILKDQKFLSGEAPAYPDYILFGTLLWPRTISPKLELLEKDDPVHVWSERMVERTA
jgi:glutathione S-transferase